MNNRDFLSALPQELFALIAVLGNFRASDIVLFYRLNKKFHGYKKSKNWDLIWKNLYRLHFEGEHSNIFDGYKKNYSNIYKDIPIKTRKLFELVKNNQVEDFLKQDLEPDDILLKDTKNNTLIDYAKSQIILDKIFSAVSKFYNGDNKNQKEQMIQSGKTLWHWVVLCNQDLSASYKNNPSLFDSYGDINAKDIINVENITPLSLAAKHGNLAIVTFLLQIKNIDINICSNAWTALFYACRYGHAEIVDLLLPAFEALSFKNIEPVWINCYGDHAIHVAQKNGHLEVVKSLVNFMPESAYARNSIGNTPLHDAIYNGHTDIVKYFFKLDKFLFTQKNNQNKTPLDLLALNKTRLEMVKFFVENDVSQVIEMKGVNGTNILMYAITWGDIELFKFMLAKKPNTFNDKDSFGNTVLHYALEGYDDGLSEYAEPNVTMMYVIDLYVNKMLDINIVNNQGVSVLHLAAEKGRLGLIKEIVGRRQFTDIDLGVKSNNTPFLLAFSAHQFDTAKFLLQLNCNVNAQNNQKLCALHILLIDKPQNYLEIAAFLLSVKNIDINLQRWDGLTPLMMAVQHGDIEYVKLLLKYNPNLDLKSNLVKQAIDLTTQSEMINLLLAAGADFKKVPMCNMDIKQIKFFKDDISKENINKQLDRITDQLSSYHNQDKAKLEEVLIDKLLTFLKEKLNENKHECRAIFDIFLSHSIGIKYKCESTKSNSFFHSSSVEQKLINFQHELDEYNESYDYNWVKNNF